MDGAKSLLINKDRVQEWLRRPGRAPITSIPSVGCFRPETKPTPENGEISISPFKAKLQCTGRFTEVVVKPEP